MLKKFILFLLVVGLSACGANRDARNPLHLINEENYTLFVENQSFNDYILYAGNNRIGKVNALQTECMTIPTVAITSGKTRLSARSLAGIRRYQSPYMIDFYYHPGWSLILYNNINTSWDSLRDSRVCN